MPVFAGWLSLSRTLHPAPQSLGGQVLPYPDVLKLWVLVYFLFVEISGHGWVGGGAQWANSGGQAQIKELTQLAS